MRITVVAKGDLEKYLEREMKRTGLSAGMSCLNLAMSGMKYEEGLKSMSVLAAALENQTRKEEENARKKESCFGQMSGY